MQSSLVIGSVVLSLSFLEGVYGLHYVPLHSQDVE
jgi:hypothetical protein